MRSGVLLSPGDGRSHGIGDIGRDLDRVLGHGTYGTVTYASVSTRELGEKTQTAHFAGKTGNFASARRARGQSNSSMNGSSCGAYQARSWSCASPTTNSASSSPRSAASTASIAGSTAGSASALSTYAAITSS